MKKLLLVPALMLAFFFSTISSVSATDVWVDHWDSENIDIYVVDDTISRKAADSTHFSAVVKEVRNGRLINQQVWLYSKYETDFWRYQTAGMRKGKNGIGHSSPVYGTPNRIFEYCADSLGIYYSNNNGYYY